MSRINVNQNETNIINNRRRHAHRVNYHHFLTLIILFAGLNTLFAEDVILSPGTPADAGMDANVLDAAVGIYKHAIENDWSRGAVLFAARKGIVVVNEAVGWRDKEKGLPMTRNAMFRMASNTKPVIAAAISILVEDGKLSYDDLVRQHIKSFDNYRSGHITVHHLLTHTSGFRIKPIFFKPLIQKSKKHPNAPNLRLEVDRFGEVGASVPVGTTYSYSNAGYNTLGALIEKISEKPLEEFLKEQIYIPLGMTDSYHHEIEGKLDGKLSRMSVVYYKNDDGTWRTGWEPGESPQYPFVRASGGMISTAMDYAIFCQTFLNGGSYKDVRILRPETIDIITKPHTKSIYSPEKRDTLTGFYGYGWHVTRQGVITHRGSDGTAAWVDPDNELIVLVFTQSPCTKNKRAASRFMKLVQAAIYE